jgi:hypothetical protein
MIMSRRRVSEEVTTARLNGHPVMVHQAHRRWNAADYAIGAPESDQHEAVLLTVTAPVHLSLDDATAVLVDWNLSIAELADDDTVRYLVAGTVVNCGCFRIEELRCQLGEAALDDDGAAYVAYCKERVATVFAAPVAPAQPARPLQLVAAV